MREFRKIVVSCCVIFGVIFFCGCKRNTPSVSFYHWKQRYNPSQWEIEYMKEVGCSRLFVRFFDVDFPPEKLLPEPISLIKVNGELKAQNIVPCVYITNRTFLRVNGRQVKNLAHRVNDLIFEIARSSNLDSLGEIQIDCDWSESTRDRYFHFLKELKGVISSTTKLSATIRLHQVKYSQRTGIPPVDRGVLMLYNMGNTLDQSEENSILKGEVIKQYISSKTPDYPLKLDLALPTYSWILVYRFHKLVRIIYPGDERLLLQSDNTKQTGDNKFRVTNNFFFGSTFLYRGDNLRFEAISPKQLSKSVNYLLNKTFLKPEEVIFYHLDSINLSRYEPKFLKDLCR